jgi:hypothetical protein
MPPTAFSFNKIFIDPVFKLRMLVSLSLKIYMTWPQIRICKTIENLMRRKKTYTCSHIRYSLLQNNIFKLEIKLYLLSTGNIDHDELFLRNLLSEQVYVFFLLIKFSSKISQLLLGRMILYKYLLTRKTTLVKKEITLCQQPENCENRNDPDLV